MGQRRTHARRRPHAQTTSKMAARLGLTVVVTVRISVFANLKMASRRHSQEILTPRTAPPTNQVKSRAAAAIMVFGAQRRTYARRRPHAQTTSKMAARLGLTVVVT